MLVIKFVEWTLVRVRDLRLIVTEFAFIIMGFRLIAIDFRLMTKELNSIAAGLITTLSVSLKIVIG